MLKSLEYRDEIRDFIDSGRNSSYRKIANNTYAVKTVDLNGNEMYGIQYHKTVIFAIREDGTICINNGGYFTSTTKKRINDALRKCGYIGCITQTKFVWRIGTDSFSGSSATLCIDINSNFVSWDLADVWCGPIDINHYKTDYYLSR